MSGNVVRVNSNYKIQAVSGGTITFDTGSNAGTTIVSGSLTVLGTLTQLSTTNTNIKDNIIILNYGDPGPGITSNLTGTSGIQITRTNISDGDGYILFDERVNWLKYSNTDNVSLNVTKNGLFTFKTANGGISGIQISSIDTGSGSLSLIGKGTGVVTVTGTADYEKQVLNYNNNYAVRDDDIIPNIKAVVDLIAFQILTNASDNIKRDNTQFIVYDNNIGQVITTFDTAGTPTISVRFNHPGVTNARLNVYVGSSITVSQSGITHLDGTWTVSTAVSTADFFYLQTSLTVNVSNAPNVSSIITVNNVKSNAKIFVDSTLVTEFQQDHADVYGLRFQDSTITATTSNTNLILDVSGSASVFVKPSTVSSSTTTGALVVNGGVGIGGSLYVNDINGVGALTVNSANKNVSLQPTGTGTVTITSGTTGTVDNMNIGNTTRGTGKFTSINVNDSTGSTDTSTGALVVTGGVGVGGIIHAGSIQGTPIGSLVPSTGKFTTVDAQNINIDTTTLTYQETDPAFSTAGVKLYAKNEDIVTTGIYFINASTQGELISKSKALAYSILFG